MEAKLEEQWRDETGEGKAVQKVLGPVFLGTLEIPGARIQSVPRHFPPACTRPGQALAA